MGTLFVLLKNNMKTLLERFNEKWIPVTESGCWIWTAFVNEKGYGKFTNNGKTYRSHRLSYELYIGEIPDGLYVCHECDNTFCVNPNHLFLGSQLDNIHDMLNKGRGSAPPLFKGEDHSLSKLTENNVIEIRKSKHMTHRQLAEKYNVSKKLIFNVIHKKAWSHVP